MGRNSNFVNTIEQTLTFRLKGLTENGNDYLTSNRKQKGVTRWYHNGQETAKIGFVLTNNHYETFIDFDYTYNSNPIKNRVQLTSKTSNLGKGKIWYFVCSQTGKHCRKLCLIGGYFVHRTAFGGIMYDKQIESKTTRAFAKVFSSGFIVDDCYSQLNKKYFKKHYNGKLTKRYKHLMNKLKQHDLY
jgi:hypothetical protein